MSNIFSILSSDKKFEEVKPFPIDFNQKKKSTKIEEEIKTNEIEVFASGHEFNHFTIFFSVYKMIGREASRIETPSLGFSKVIFFANQHS